MPTQKNAVAEPLGIVEYHPMMRDIAASERPRERLIKHGPQALSEAELLAIILRVGTRGENVVRMAERLVTKYGRLSGLLRASIPDLSAETGMGNAKAAQVKAALELARRLSIESPDERPIVKSPEDAANLIKVEMSAFEQEHMRVILLDTRNRVMDAKDVYVGSLNTAVVRIAELFREPIRQGAAAVIIAHNHPSGDPSPSPEDVKVTEQLVAAGKLLDIEVLDHLIIGQGRFVSLKERGLGFA